MEIKPALRCREGEMGLKKSDRKKPGRWRAREIAQIFDGFISNPSIRVSGVWSIEGLEGGSFSGSTGHPVGVAVHDVLGLPPRGFWNPGAGPRPRQFFRAFIPELAGAATRIVGDLTEREGAIAMTLKPSGQISFAPTSVRQGNAAIIDLRDLVRIAAAQQGAAGCSASRNLHIMVRKTSRGGREGVELGRLRIGCAQRTEVVAQIVDCNKQHIGSRAFGGGEHQRAHEQDQ